MNSRIADCFVQIATGFTITTKERSPGRIQTCTRRIRSAMHYSVMLRGRMLWQRSPKADAKVRQTQGFGYF